MRRFAIFIAALAFMLIAVDRSQANGHGRFEFRNNRVVFVETFNPFNGIGINQGFNSYQSFNQGFSHGYGGFNGYGAGGCNNEFNNLSGNYQNFNFQQDAQLLNLLAVRNNQLLLSGGSRAAFDFGSFPLVGVGVGVNFNRGFSGDRLRVGHIGGHNREVVKVRGRNGNATVRVRQ